MGSAFGERDDVVDFLGGCQHVCLGALLTQRVYGDILVTDTFPCPAIAFACGGIALVLLVPLCLLLIMCRAEAVVRQRRTARMTARTLWFSWHIFHLQSKQKALGDQLQRLLCFVIIFDDTSIAGRKAKCVS